MDKQTYCIDGARFSTLDEFFAEISRVLIPGAIWGRNLDAFHDILGGGFGTPDGGFVLVWKHPELSRTRLGYAETVRQLEQRLKRCHPLSVPGVRDDLARAQRGESTTVFDWLVQMLHDNSDWGVELRLE